MKQCICSMIVVLCSLALSNLAIGDELHEEQGADHGHSLDAHVHGVAELHIVLEADYLSLELHSPAMNLLGFEHYTASPEQRAVLNNIRDKLADTRKLFRVDDGSCSLEESIVDFSSVLNEQEKLSHLGNHHDEKHVPHNEGHSTHSQHKVTHSDIEAHYQYSCRLPSQLRSISVGLHEIFPGIESLRVQWIIHGRQGGVTLNGEIQEIHFE